MHSDPIAPVLLALAVILVGSRVGGELAARLGQPPVLGELMAGIVIGNLHLAGFTALDFIRDDRTIAMLAQLGVLLLLFQVGLESTVRQMIRVGWSALLVATLGVVTPFALGWLVSARLMPGASPQAHAFIGATLCATSVGITARVLKDLGRSESDEARIILGAAVIDDVMGLVILAAVTSVIEASSAPARTFSVTTLVLIVVKAVVFLFGSLAAGTWLAPLVFRQAARLRAPGVLLALGLASCFTLAWIATRVGLAAIVGAFAAGLILEDVHYRSFVGRGEHRLEELVEPISSFLTPVFFMLMGMQTSLAAFANPAVLAFAGALIVAAVAGKQACSLGVLTRGVDRLSVGIGMIPRGEVGLIFANVGLGLFVDGERVMNAEMLSAVVMMVVITTVLTPPALKWSLGRSGRETRISRALPRGSGV